MTYITKKKPLMFFFFFLMYSILKYIRNVCTFNLVAIHWFVRSESCGKASAGDDKAHARRGVVPRAAGHRPHAAHLHARELRVRGGGRHVEHTAAVFSSHPGGVRGLGGHL